MKRMRIALFGLAVVLLTGCGGTMPALTEDEVNKISEYAAITLLKYDANSKSRLVDLDAIPEVQEVAEPEKVEPQPESTEPEQQNLIVIDRTDQGGSTAANSIEDFMGLPEGMSLTYAGYDVTNSYQEDDEMYFALEASAGKMLLILHFELDNQTGETQNVRFIDQRNSYRISVNGNYTRSSLTTMLENDLGTYMGSVAAGECKTLVLLIEIDPETASQIDSVTLDLRNEQRSYTIQLI